MIHAFHGFLGSPYDLAFLGPDTRLHDLSSLCLETLAEEQGPEDVLIGYSMGGRVALELAVRRNFQIKKLVLINAHPGLESEEEKSARSRWEDEVLARLQEQSPEDFLNYWNALPVFAHDAPIGPLSKAELSKGAELFHRFRLSRQQNFLPALKEHRDRVLMLIGSLDEKYQKMAQERLLPENIRCRFLDGGHRLFQRPEALCKALKEEEVL